MPKERKELDHVVDELTSATCELEAVDKRLRALRDSRRSALGKSLGHVTAGLEKQLRDARDILSPAISERDALACVSRILNSINL